MTDLSVRIESSKSELSGWQHFWGKRVSAFDPELHCARCLIGSYVKAVSLKAPVNEDVPLSGYAIGDILYICGVAKPNRWMNNLHIAVRVTGDLNDKANVEAYTSDRLTITGAVLIPFSDATARKLHGHRDETYLTCRNFQFGAQMAARGLLPLRARDMRANEEL